MVMLQAVPVVREYPMKSAAELSPFDHWSRAALARGCLSPGAGKVFLQQVTAFASGLAALDDTALLARTHALRPALRRTVWHRSARPLRHWPRALP